MSLDPPEPPQLFTVIFDDDWVDDIVSWQFLEGFWFLKTVENSTVILDLKKHSPVRMVAKYGQS